MDIDWSDPAAQADALARLLAEVDRVEAWVAAHVPVAEAPPVQAALGALRRGLAQDLEPDPTTGQRRIRRGVAAERMPSLGDPEMRHGRKTQTKRFTGYKRHVIKRVDADLIVGAVVRPANEPEHLALALVEPDLVQHGLLAELQIDRGYLGSARIGPLHAQGVVIRAKGWTSPNGVRFPKQAFTIDLAAARTCARRLSDDAWTRRCRPRDVGRQPFDLGVLEVQGPYTVVDRYGVRVQPTEGSCRPFPRTHAARGWRPD